MKSAEKELEKILATKLEEISVLLPARAENCLIKTMGMDTIEQLLMTTEEEITSQRYIGEKTLSDIKEAIAAAGIPLEERYVIKNVKDKGRAYQKIASKGKERFEAMMQYKQFENAIKTYWNTEKKELPFIDYLEIFTLFSQGMTNYDSISSCLSINEMSAEDILIKAVDLGLIKMPEDEDDILSIKSMIMKGMRIQKIAEKRDESYNLTRKHIIQYGLLEYYKKVPKRKKMGKQYYKIISQIDEGKNMIQIAKENNVSRQAISDYINRKGLKEYYYNKRAEIKP